MESPQLTANRSSFSGSTSEPNSCTSSSHVSALKNETIASWIGRSNLISEAAFCISSKLILEIVTCRDTSLNSQINNFPVDT